MDNNYLSHHGILGQRWGIRRFQNKDGSLTAAGRKRAAKLEAKYEKVTGKKDISEKNYSKSKVSVDKMTDQELRDAIARKQLENQYNSLYPVQVKRGKQFINNFKDEMVREVPKTLTNQIKNAISKTLEKKINEYFKETDVPYSELLTKDVSKLSDKDLTRLSERLKKESSVKTFRDNLNKKDQKTTANQSDKPDNSNNSEENNNSNSQTKNKTQTTDSSSSTNKQDSGQEHVSGKTVNNPYSSNSKNYADVDDFIQTKFNDSFWNYNSSKYSKDTQSSGKDFIDTFLIEDKRYDVTPKYKVERLSIEDKRYDIKKRH